MNVTLEQLAEFRHRVRSELNQILGYSELLSADDSADVSASSKTILQQLQATTRRILQIAQLEFNGDTRDAGELRLRVKTSIAQSLDQLGADTAQLVNQLPSSLLPDLQRIQAAYLGLRAAMEQPIKSGKNNHGLRFTSFDMDRPYSAAIPQELRVNARLLIVDDSEANWQLIERQVKDLGLEVKNAADGAAAIIALATEPFDCVLLDMVLPDMHGPAVLRAIRANPDWSGIPVLMLTAMDEVKQAAMCIEFGAEDYIVGPVERSFLRAKLYSTIQRKKLYEDCQMLGQNLTASNEELKRFVLVASHDLQVPLRTLKAKLASIHSMVNSGRLENVDDLIEDCSFRCERMSTLVRDLLLYARLGQVEPTLERVELDWVISEAIANAQIDIEKSGAVIRHPQLPAVTVDFKQILHVFQNLLSNSILYKSSEPPVIEIDFEERQSDYLFHFRDNGIGIPESQRHQVFEAFRRLHGDDCPGTGLGLSIAQRAIEKAGGKIWAEAVEGQGSSFAFTLPKPEEHSGVAE